MAIGKVFGWVAIGLAVVTASARAETPSSMVGMEEHFEAMLLGPELIVRPAERNPPLVVRIASARTRGAVVRYDFRFTGFVPGEYDLRNYLVRQDDSQDDSLPPIPVQITGLLPPDHQGRLTPHRDQPFSLREAYRWAMAAAAVVWVVVAIRLGLAVFRRTPSARPGAAHAIVFSDERLQPLLAGATAGRLDPGQKLQLERLLLRYWRDRLDLHTVEAPEALARLRDHPEAGVLFLALEDWLYRRPGTGALDLQTALLPYGNFDAPPAGNGNSPAMLEQG